jgi:4-carboxymuconolactone decarboxylase
VQITSLSHIGSWSFKTGMTTVDLSFSLDDPIAEVKRHNLLQCLRGPGHGLHPHARSRTRKLIYFWEEHMVRIFALLILVAIVTGATAGERFPILQPDQMNADQKKLLEALLAGPRGGGNTSSEATQKMLRGGPFNAWMRSPDLGNRLQSVGEYIRYRTSLPLRLNEFAILITAREWTSQYEWHAHYPLAVKAGLDAKVADELALGKRPSAMTDDEAAVYEFCIQLHRRGSLLRAASHC